MAASAESAQAAASTTAWSAAAVGKERNLSLLNPEISLTGIFLGTTTSGGRDEFSVEEFELDLQSALDPYSRTRVTLAVGDEGVELEEIYVNYSGLPGGTRSLRRKVPAAFRTAQPAASARIAAERVPAGLSDLLR